MPVCSCGRVFRESKDEVKCKVMFMWLDVYIGVSSVGTAGCVASEGGVESIAIAILNPQTACFYIRLMYH